MFYITLIISGIVAVAVGGTVEALRRNNSLKMLYEARHIHCQGRVPDKRPKGFFGTVGGEGPGKTLTGAITD